ncbi:unnamed protein product, partial [Prunus brigantina]
QTSDVLWRIILNLFPSSSIHGEKNQGLLSRGLHFLLCQTLSLYMASFEGIRRIGYLHMWNPKETEKDEYHEFYKKTFSGFLDPVAYTHFTTEV